MPEYNISILNIFLWSSKGFYFLCSLYAVSKNYMYSTCSFDETHVVLQTAHKLHIKNVLMFDHSPVKNIQSLDLVSTKKK